MTAQVANPKMDKLINQLDNNMKMILAGHIGHQNINFENMFNIEDSENDPDSIKLKPSPYYSTGLFNSMVNTLDLSKKLFNIIMELQHTHR